MRRSLLSILTLFAFGGPAYAQFCPGAPGWVFDDVPASDMFCSYITWAAQNGVTQGCLVIDASHRLYCPNDGVARNQLAAFANRLMTMPDSTAPDVGTITKPGGPFLHNFGTNGTYVGVNAGNFTGLGVNNTGVGAGVLHANSFGTSNTAIGTLALNKNTLGSQNTAVGAFALSEDLDGTHNTAVGSDALSSNTSNLNTALGASALRQNTSGGINTAVGAFAMADASMGSINSAFGAYSLAGNQSGSSNTAIGFSTLFANIGGSQNSAVGVFALGSNMSGDNNTAIGMNALYNSTSGALNVAVGVSSMYWNTIGGGNVAIGSGALSQNVAGSRNIAIGAGAGDTPTAGQWNIHIGNGGVVGDSHTIRIGDDNHARTYVAGIRGVVTAANDAVAVVVDSNGQLGTISSSRNGKADIAEMSDASAALMQLRPVTFHYKADKDSAGPRLQYGLIAEEVAEIYPGMVATRDGKPETVMYQYLAPMLLNEYQKQQRTIEVQAREIAELKRAVETLMARTAPDRVANAR